MATLKAYSAGTEPAFPASYDVTKRVTLNFTDIVSNNNKYYNAEVQVSKDGSARIYTQYGRLGGTAAKEYRVCTSQTHAELEADKIIKSKIKKGYVEVKLVKADVGSEVGKSIVTSSILNETAAIKLGYKIQEDIPSVLHPAIQSVVKTWFGSIDKFVIDTLDTSKCALGQLSLDQINKGRDLLLEARKIVIAGAKDIKSLNDISSKYYSNIPMNFGYRKLDVDKLRFDTNDKLDLAFDILDTLEGAKDAQKVLSKKNAVDEQYKSLKTEMEVVDTSDPIWKWIDTMFHKTRASNHNFLGKMKIHNIFKLSRDEEQKIYMSMAETMASKSDKYDKDLPSLLKPIWSNKVKEDRYYQELIDRANILPLFHGTRTPNFPKILSSRLMMRKPGFTVAGAMYDKNGGLYFGMSSKSINYSSAAGSYWSGGSDKTAYIFLSDVALGKQKIATGAYPYTLDGIKPCMSVWAKGGQSGVVNDEFIVYTEKQNWLRYVIEFETMLK
ncbi:Poly(ADP-ribose) polymerase, regulatory domain containing protein [uncultured Caudovirales phage]|uniref:NAD(+) ADP-ribosyltransferase n=1 Tax=uncultured Caudovirales phage TaxID=2100421 RepID=A0A6J5RLI0_9CAUD|nr:Poly(ADP-ribose) polymerase, regulatory domain containing protein [uncultured Caudovirales phage]